jgi:hypothetical protein
MLYNKSFKILAMKKTIKIAVTGLVLSLISFCSFAQDNASPVSPRWISDKGYWVIESNIHTPLDHIILFYNNDNVLVYKETVTGVRINANKRKVKMKLKKALESALTAWEEKKVPGEDKNYVLAALH